MRQKAISPCTERDTATDPVFFRQDLIRVFSWLMVMRWSAVAVGSLAAWWIYYIDREFPIPAVQGILLAIGLYNTIFFFLWRLKSTTILYERSVIFISHVQIGLDFLALFVLISITGGIYSPLLIFVIFPIVLAGILFSPTTSLIYGVLILTATGGLIAMEEMGVIPAPIAMSRSLLFSGRIVLIPYVCFAIAVLVTGVLVTTTASRLRAKGKALSQASQQLDASNAKLTALYEMVKEMGLSPDLQKMMDSATRNAARIMGVKGCSIKLLDEKVKTLRFASTYGLSQDYLAKGMIEIEKSPINRQIIEGSVCAIGGIDAKDYFQYPEDIRREGIASMMCLPLRVEKKIFGIFCVYSGESHHFEQDDVRFFSLMTDLTAIAIENLRSGLLKSWFMMKASHQLRAPLNAIYTMLKPLSDGYLGPVAPSQADTIDKCLKRIKNLGDMINDLLKLGERKSEIAPPTWYPVDLVKVVPQMTDFYRVQAEQKGIDFHLKIDNTLPKVRANEKLIDDLLTNLISNAIKYTGPGGRVQVSFSKDSQSRIQIEVSDTGIGISEEDLPRLFTEFFRTEAAKSCGAEGTGLGLAIVKEILDHMGGSIDVYSSPGGGTRFLCCLPPAPNS